MAKIKKTGRHTQALKSARQALSHRVENNAKRSVVKDLGKQLTKALTAKDTGKAKELVTGIYSALDKAAKTGVFHWRNAARKKSKYARQVTRALSVPVA
ncbi:MAG: 30S ribosomal protein S20 [Elusimicrobiota bacterium]